MTLCFKKYTIIRSSPYRRTKLEEEILSTFERKLTAIQSEYDDFHDLNTQVGSIGLTIR